MIRKRVLTALLLRTLGALGSVFLSNPLKPSGPVALEVPQETKNSEWKLAIYGFVQNPMNLTFNELIAMPRSTVNAELYCVDNPKNPRSKGNWTGVKLGLILERAGVSPKAVKVAFYASDDYSTDLTVTTAMREDIILAYEKDGERLSEKTRLVVPGKWGYKWISQLTRIELVNYDFKGFWESRGYSDEADITSSS